MTAALLHVGIGLAAGLCLNLVRLRRRLAALRLRWADEEELQRRREDDEAWGAGYSALADRARVLGWDGTGSMWGLLGWAGVKRPEMAGPHGGDGRRQALRLALAVVNSREAALAGSQLEGDDGDLTEAPVDRRASA